MMQRIMKKINEVLRQFQWCECDLRLFLNVLELSHHQVCGSHLV